MPQTFLGKASQFLLTLLLGGGIGEWEKVLLSIHCCTQHSLILLYHILTHFELEQRDFDLFLVFGNTEILKMYH